MLSTSTVIIVSLFSQCITISYAFTTSRNGVHNRQNLVSVLNKTPSKCSFPTTLHAFFNQKEAESKPKSILDDDVETEDYGLSFFPRRGGKGVTRKEEVKMTEDIVELDDKSLAQMIGFGGIIAAGATAAIVASLGLSLPDPQIITSNIQNFFSDPTTSLEAVVESVEAMGPYGFLYFGTVYTVAEILAIPAIPLTASAGYLFGVKEGTAVVLTSASIAAAISFLIGRTFLRSYVEKTLENYPEFRKIDSAIGKEGFKLMLLLRLSPIFPFALSNYLYGVTSVRFWPYFWGTMIGFTPGTIAYVYTGEMGKALTLDSAETQEWYVYVGGLAILTGFLKIAADVASSFIDNIENERNNIK